MVLPRVQLGANCCHRQGLTNELSLAWTSALCDTLEAVQNLRKAQDKIEALLTSQLLLARQVGVTDTAAPVCFVHVAPACNSQLPGCCDAARRNAVPLIPAVAAAT